MMDMDIISFPGFPVLCVQYNTRKWKRSHKATTNWIIVSPLLVKDAIACGAGGFSLFITDVVKEVQTTKY